MNNIISLITFLVLMTTFNIARAEEKAGNLDHPLAKTLEEKSKQSAATIPAADKAIMEKSLRQLKESAILNDAPTVGDEMPDHEFLNSKGEKTRLYSLLNDNEAIVTFYRGGWCPYCNLQLHAYQAHLASIKSKGAELIAISPEIPREADKTITKNALEFAVLSDINNDFARKLKIVFDLGSNLQETYKKFGIDLVKNQNNNSWSLPLAATFVVGKDKKIKYVFLDTDYKKRAEPTEVIMHLN